MHKRALLLLFSTFLLSCNQILDIEETTLEIPPSGPWRCVKGEEDPAPAKIPPKIKLSMSALAYQNFKPQGGIRFRACGKNDPICSISLGEVISDEEGKATLVIDMTDLRGFNGFIEITDQRTPEQRALPTAIKGDFVPFHYFFSNLLYGDLVVPPSVVTTQSDVDQLAKAAGMTLEDGKSAGLNHISATVLDCDGNPTAGVSFKFTNVPDDSRTWYFDKGTASSTATKTDATGLGGILNLKEEEDCGIIASVGEKQVSTGNINLAAGAFHTILMLPQ